MDKSICFWTWSYHVWPEGNVCGDIIARFRELSYWISIIVTVQRHMRVSLLPRGNISSLIPSISFSDGWMQKKSIKPQKNGHEIDSVFLLSCFISLQKYYVLLTFLFLSYLTSRKTFELKYMATPSFWWEVLCTK